MFLAEMSIQCYKDNIHLNEHISHHLNKRQYTVDFLYSELLR